jgi:hypothetical protein
MGTFSDKMPRFSGACWAKWAWWGINRRNCGKYDRDTSVHHHTPHLSTNRQDISAATAIT